MAITATGIIAEYGAYYQKGSQNEKNLLKKLYKDAQFDSLFTYLPTTDTVIKNVKVASASVLQAFQKQFTPAGGVTFTPQTIYLDHIKADDEIYPDDIEKTYLGFLAANDLDRKTWPIVRWWVEEVLMKQFIEDIEANAFTGVRVNPTAGTAGSPSGALNGFRKHIQTLVAASQTNVLATGAIEAAPIDFVTQLEEWVAMIDPLYKSKMELRISLSPELALKFRQGNRAKYNLNWNQQSDLDSIVDFPRVKIQEVLNQAGSNKIWCTDKRNLVLAMKRPTEAVMFGQDMRLIKASTDHHRTYAVVDPRLFWTNDLENS